MATGNDLTNQSPTSPQVGSGTPPPTELIYKDAPMSVRVDSHLACRKCKVRVYTLYGVPVPGQAGIYTHRLWPCEGSWSGPPGDPSRLQCPTCGSDLVRTSANIDPTKDTF